MHIKSPQFSPVPPGPDSVDYKCGGGWQDNRTVAIVMFHVKHNTNIVCLSLKPLSFTEARVTVSFIRPWNSLLCCATQLGCQPTFPPVHSLPAVTTPGFGDLCACDVLIKKEEFRISCIGALLSMLIQWKIPRQQHSVRNWKSFGLFRL